MNLQDILDPIEALFMWSFDVLKMGGQNFNYLLIILMAVAAGYWLFKLFGYESQEMTNR